MLFRRLSLSSAALATGLFAMMTDAEAQVRRGINPGSGDRPAAPAPAPAPAETPSPEEQPNPEGGDPEEGEERTVDPEWVARMVEFRGPLWLLEQEAIREELKIDDEQIERIKKADEYLEQAREETFNKMREQMRLMQQRQQQAGPGGRPGFGGAAPGFGGRPGFGGGGPGFGGRGGRGDRGGGPGGDAFRQMREQMEQQSNRMLGQLLTEEQRERFQQIMLQARGPMAVTEPDLMKALNVVPSQQQQIAMILQQQELKENQNSQARRALFTAAFANRNRDRDQNGQEQEGRPQPGRRDNNDDDDDDDDDNDRRGRFQMDEETRSKLEQFQTQEEAIEQETIRKIGAVLTRNQKERYYKMLGKKFDFSKLELGNGGGRGGFFFGGDRGDRGGRGDRG